MRTRVRLKERLGFWRAAVFACALVTLGVMAVACGGGEEETDGQTQGSPLVTPAVALPNVPPDSAEKAGLLIYRDNVAGLAIALNLSTGERARVNGIAPAAVTTMTAFDCTSDGKMIAYGNLAGGGSTTVISFAGDGARTQSVEVQGTVQGMAWSPAADRLVLNTYGQEGLRLALLDVSSGTVTPLPFGTGTPGLPRWSPDGARIVYDMNENGKSDIFVLDVNGGAPVKVSTRPSAFTPDWSPDGNTIVFVAGDDEGGQPQVYAVGPDGSNERKLTSSTSQKWSPRWSLDGSLISFAGLLVTPAVSVRPVLAHNQAVWVANRDGANEVLVTDLGIDAQSLAWCKRGPWI